VWDSDRLCYSNRPIKVHEWEVGIVMVHTAYCSHCSHGRVLFTRPVLFSGRYCSWRVVLFTERENVHLGCSLRGGGISNFSSIVWIHPNVGKPSIIQLIVYFIYYLLFFAGTNERPTVYH
jgi:hypothetical protein